MYDIDKVNELVDKIAKKNEEIEEIKKDIFNLAFNLNEECKKVIFSKFKEGQFLTHRNKYVFILGSSNCIHDCQVNVKSFCDLEYKSFYASTSIGVCRAVSLIDNARPSTQKEIIDYYYSKKMAQDKVLGIKE